MLHVLGFTVMFLPPCLLLVGRIANADWLLPSFFFAGLPILTVLFGSVQKRLDSIGPIEAQVLWWLPRLYVVVFAATMIWVLRELSSGVPDGLMGRIGFPVALLVMCGLASCVAHDLLHRSDGVDRFGAHLVCAMAGYPFFVYEHLGHHAAPRETENANCPRTSENVWMFAWRRFWIVPSQSFALWRKLGRSRRGSSMIDNILLWSLVTVATAAGFYGVGGAYGLICYAVLVAGVPLLLNTVTYIQHWGLGDDNPGIPGRIKQIGWDDATRLQSWLILGISFHDEHHANPSRAYYTYAPSDTAPRLPSEYALMVLACFVPPLWRRLMMPRLKEWTSRIQPGQSTTL